MSSQVRNYERAKSIVFLKTKEAFGGLSNMAGGFPLRVNGVRIFSAEALYQACRFPHMPDVQRLILGEPSPMTAKMRGKPYRNNSRPDWDQVRVRIMRWCLRVKLIQHWNAFGKLLLATEDKPIVEASKKDDFWGAKPADANTLVGMNVLGRLLMELREELKGEQRDALLRLEPLAIPDFCLLGQPIPEIEAFSPDNKRTHYPPIAPPQPSLFVEDAGATRTYDNALAIRPIEDQSSNESRVLRIDRLQPYSNYAESNLPWLGKIPVHWNLRRLKFLLREVDSRSTTGKEQLLRVSQYTGVTQRKSIDGADAPDSRAESLIGYKRVRANDLVINIMLAWNGSLGVSRFDGIASPAYCVYRFNKETLPWYYHELLRLPAYKGRMKVASTGVVESRLRLYSGNLGCVEAILPPIAEQVAIVRFLDHVTHQLDKTIRAKRKIIALLNEQKQAIIHRAVTRGLDPDVPLKDSGIPWLGQIPAHWDVVPAKRLCALVRDGTHLPPPRTPSGFPLLSVRNIICGKLVRRSDDSLISPKDFALLNRSFQILQGDVLLAIVGATLGKVAVVETNEPFQIQRSLAVFRPRLSALRPDYFSTFLRSPNLQSHLWRSVAFSAQPGIYLGFIANIPVPLPSIREQEQIFQAITRETAPVTVAIESTEGEVSLLREYRTRLIADVVTGKLDVREAAANLPASAPEIAEELHGTEADEALDDLAEEAA